MERRPLRDKTDALRVVDRALRDIPVSTVRKIAAQKMKKSIAWKHLSEIEVNDLLDKLFGEGE